jgi:hypothetical protein
VFLGEEITKGGGVPDFEISELAAIYANSKQQFIGEYDTELG